MASDPITLWKISSVQSLSLVWLFVTPWTAKHQAYLSITNSQSFLNLMSIQLVMSSILSTHLLMSTHPLSSSSPPAFNLSQHQGLFQCHNRWSKYWSFSFNISPSNTYSGLISFRMDWLDVLAVQDSQESSPTLQFKSINSLMLSFPYGPTLTSIHDYRKNHGFDYMDLCW